MLILMSLLFVRYVCPLIENSSVYGIHQLHCFLWRQKQIQLLEHPVSLKIRWWTKYFKKDCVSYL